MADHDDFDEGAANRSADPGYTSRHPVPNIQRYEEQLQRRKEIGKDTEASDDLQGETDSDATKQALYRHPETAPQPGQDHGTGNPDGNPDTNDGSHKEDGRKVGETTTHGTSQDQPNPNKNSKKPRTDYEEREVTDPVTHLPVTIHDFTEKELKRVPDNLLPRGAEPDTSAGPKSEAQRDREQASGHAKHEGMESLFPPPEFQSTKQQLTRTYENAIAVGLSTGLVISLLTIVLSHVLNGPANRSWVNLILTSGIICFVGVGLGFSIVWGVRGWLHNRIDAIWDDQVWQASRQKEEQAQSEIPESTQWLNSVVASVWPLINPDLFTSLADTLEDVMQASLPKLVRMISVEDLGQGSEALRILGVRWLPTGAAAMNVSVDGKVKSDEDNDNDNDRTVPGQGEMNNQTDSNTTDEQGHKNENSKEVSKEQEGSKENLAEGMEAEEGDFVNIEVAFSYRVSSSGKGIGKKAKNAHLYLAFYLPGRIRFRECRDLVFISGKIWYFTFADDVLAVWVELRGIIGTVRMRLQLCPDPPFFALCTLTLLGQPKVDLSCVPLTKHMLNIMDLPVISSFVQNSIDAALAEYVAPKSLTVNLQDMLVGDDFKKDTDARGILVVRVKRAIGFKEGDLKLMGGSSDPYVSVGWAKFGKPMWSTRIILGEMEPMWDETAFIIIGHAELNAQERLRLQLWDSDRTSADDDLGRVEVDLRDLMQDARSSGKMWDREDGFLAAEAKETMPGTLYWSVGYYGKADIQTDQFEQQTVEPNLKNLQELKDRVSQEAKNKVKEDTEHDDSAELKQQKARDLKVREDNIIISSPPPMAFPSGILSIQIHNITGLQLQKLNKDRNESDDGEDEAEGDDKLPSSYCNIIINHRKVFKTRTKPKNAKPFFNAGTERMIRDWRSTDVMVSVRDARVHENDPLLGLVYLPLGKIFHKRCQINDHFPLVGGIGYGQVRISMVFRAIRLQAPKELLGWDYGTVEIAGSITSRNLPSNLHGLRLKARSSVNRGKLYSSGSDDTWTAKYDRHILLAIRKRYSSCIVFEFRSHSTVFDNTPAFAVLWLKDVPDNEEKTMTLSVWQGHKTLKRAEANCLESMGEKAGTIEVPIRFWPGLGGYHKSLAKGNPDVKDVLEVLDTASDSKEVQEAIPIDDDNDSDSSDEEPNPDGGEMEQQKRNPGPIQQVKDYKDHHKELHRQQRGLMQWKGARTADWMKTKLEHGKDHIADRFKHHERGPGIETEV